MTILSQAQAIIDGQRKQEYGDVNESFSQIASLWSAYLGKELTGFDVANLMILMKVSRAKNKFHLDSYVDIAGYAACAGRLEAILNKSTQGSHIKKVVHNPV